eukprot:251375_1
MNPTTTSSCTNGGTQELILHLRDANDSIFNISIKTTGLENENNPFANTFSTIGNLNAPDFIDILNNEYEFYLVYRNTIYPDRPYVESDIFLRWKQSIWLTTPFIGDPLFAPGYQEIDFQPPEQPFIDSDDKFYGLGLSNQSGCYLDGTSFGFDWFHSVGAVNRWVGGVPSHNRGTSKSQELYACRIGCTPSALVQSFSIKTATHVDSGSPHTITLTLWFNDIIYECNIVPANTNTVYMCDSNSYTIISACGAREYKLKIEVPDANAPIFSSASVIASDGTLYGINSWCIPNSLVSSTRYQSNPLWITSVNDTCGIDTTQYTNLCIDTQEGDCAPAKQIIYFDTSKPNEYRESSLWTDATITTISPTQNPTTILPTTTAPTTSSPTTNNPTTLIPTTLIPTTLIPTTLIPTTLIPTTLIPTTMAPTTSSPTFPYFPPSEYPTLITTIPTMLPTTVFPTISPLTLSPSIYPTKPTISPLTFQTTMSLTNSPTP